MNLTTVCEEDFGNLLIESQHHLLLITLMSDAEHTSGGFKGHLTVVTGKCLYHANMITNKLSKSIGIFYIL